MEEIIKKVKKVKTYSEFELEVFSDILDWRENLKKFIHHLSREELIKMYWAEYLKD